ncbi:MAG: hypothetical protein LBV54_04425 [Puniceicoccales bacterium]|nr:hypothetical protein [Puniceicoccales bacterium]
MSSSSPQHYWMQRARRLVWRVNSGWWLARFAPLAFAASLAGLPVLLWSRAAGSGAGPFWAVFSGVLLLTALFAAWQTRHLHENAADALARLDNTLSLHNRLSSARAGVGDWPPVPYEAPSGAFRWKLGRAGGLLLSSATLLVLAAVVAIPSGAYTPPPSPEIPPALNDVRTWTSQLREEKLVEPKALEALEEKTDALLRHPQGDWYKAGAMEAAEHLREQTAQTLKNLDKDLAAIESAVAQAQAFMDKLPEPLAEALQKSLAEALQGLDLSTLPITSLQRDQLRNLDMKALTKMSPEQLKTMLETLNKNREALARNGGTKQGAGKQGTGKQGEKPADGPSIPAFLFAPGKSDPLDRLLELAKPSNNLLVRRAFTALTPHERDLIQKASAEGRLAVRAENGAEKGEVEGVVFLPSTSSIPGITDPADALVEDALAMLLEDPATRTPPTAQQLDAVLKALRDNRVRLSSFSLKENQGECKNPSASGAVALCLTASAGKGGRGGGPSAPLTFGDQSPGMNARNREQLAGKDREHDTLGDMQGLGTGKHKVDKNAYKGPVSGGTAASTGDGGDSVWVDNLTPEERATLKTYFK